MAVVQSWVDDPGANHGLIVASASASNGLGFASREAPVAIERPELTITYSQAEPVAGAHSDDAGENTLLTVTSLAGQAPRNIIFFVGD